MQKITNIEIKNFKSIRHQKIEDCRRVNVFIGPPNVGKSNILEALGIYSHFQLEDNPFKFSDICRVKHFSELFFNKDAKEATTITIDDSIWLELIITETNDLAVRIHTRFIPNSGEPYKETLFSAQVNNKSFEYNNFKISRDPLDRYIINFVKKYEFKNDVILDQRRPLALAMPFGANLIDVLQQHSNLRKGIADLFEEYNLTLFLDGEEIKFLKYFSERTGISIGYHLIADTLKRLIFYKTAIETNVNSVLLFEEPEAHMFPPYISKFTSDIMNDEKDNQFFITTHSPFVLNDFMEQLDKNELSIYLIDIKNGETIVRKMSDDEVHEAYQFGYDFFLNLKNFMRAD